MKKGLTFVFFIFALIFSFPPFILMSDIGHVEGSPVLGMIICILIDGLMWFIFFKQIISSIKHKKVEKNGTEYTATFISFESNVIVNNIPRFTITYVWENEQGERKQGKSGSDYTIMEAEAFERIKKFKIKALGNDSIIITNPALLIAEAEEIELESGKTICEYCDTVYDQEKDKCPHCNAPRTK